jgi:hypothetical protein
MAIRKSIIFHGDSRPGVNRVNNLENIFYEIANEDSYYLVEPRYHLIKKIPDQEQLQILLTYGPVPGKQVSSVS